MTAVAGRRMAETVARRGGLAVLPQDIPVDGRARGRGVGQGRGTSSSTPRSRSRRTAPVSDALALLPKRAHGAVIVVDDGRPVGVVTEADCAGADRFAQLHQVMSPTRSSRCRPGRPAARPSNSWTPQHRKLAPVVDATAGWSAS